MLNFYTIRRIIIVIMIIIIIILILKKMERDVNRNVYSFFVKKKKNSKAQPIKLNKTSFLSYYQPKGDN